MKAATQTPRLVLKKERIVCLTTAPAQGKVNQSTWYCDILTVTTGAGAGL